MVQEGRWNLNCQVCGGQDELLGCDVIFSTPLPSRWKAIAVSAEFRPDVCDEQRKHAALQSMNTSQNRLSYKAKRLHPYRLPLTPPPCNQ